MAWKRARFYRFLVRSATLRDGSIAGEVRVSEGYATDIDGYVIGVSKDSYTMATDITTGCGLTLPQSASSLDDLKAAVESDEFIEKFREYNRSRRVSADESGNRTEYAFILESFNESAAVYEKSHGSLEQPVKKSRKSLIAANDNDAPILTEDDFTEFGGLLDE